MSYTVKSSGKASLKSVDLMCPECKYEEERTIDLRECDTEELVAQAMIVKCPNCDHDSMEQVWRRAPSSPATHSLSDMHPGNISRMQQSFKERFIKKEVDDVRHKFGKLYDDGVRSAAAARIKKSVKKNGK